MHRIARLVAIGVAVISSALVITAIPASASTFTERQALGDAKDYLSFTSFSKLGLIDQVKFDGFSRRAATYAANHVHVSWNKEAVKSAKNYLSFSHFSKSGLISQLEFDKYTHSQAVYGVNHTRLR